MEKSFSNLGYLLNKAQQKQINGGTICRTDLDCPSDSYCRNRVCD
ncbi:hypothetical protein DFQ07_2515 [Tenacibaculum caenipelagi]|uniref:Uncharacterized protein n=1 Tax=Tenacibaculum caenipelagi TaxID=1325435 RepID=A0A4R6TAP8_9FLAO|nr:hypothetical protein DFQ07_2515 [Tenacibaculum caenipelagi]